MAHLLRGEDVTDILELRRQGLSISQISAHTGYDRKTIRKYLNDPSTPRYGPRSSTCEKRRRGQILEPFTNFIDQRLTAGVWNAVVIHRELRERGYGGGYTVVKDYLRPKRREAQAVAVRRFETPPGHQAQVDWGELGVICFPEGERKKLYGFVMTLGHSRAMFAGISTDQKLPTFLRMHEAAFQHLGGVPCELLYDWTKTAALGLDERGEVVWQSGFSDFAGYYGFRPRLCRAYRPQTKGKVESGIGYLRKSFLLAQYGQEPTSIEDLQSRLRVWLSNVANVRVHGTTHRVVREAWEEEKPHLRSILGRAAYPLPEEQTVRIVSRDAFVSYRANRYSVPWQSAGQEVVVREKAGTVEVLRNDTVLATHTLSTERHQTLVIASHHEGIPTADTASTGRRGGKPRLSLKFAAPDVEVRSLAAYEEACAGSRVMATVSTATWEGVA
jgi:transposase